MTTDEDGRPAERDDDIYPSDGVGRRQSLSRRYLLSGSATLGVAATAGCLGDDESGDADTDVVEQPTVFVSNTGDGSVTVIDTASQSVVETRSLGLSTSFPSNQHTPALTTGATDPIWLNVGEGSVRSRPGHSPNRHGTRLARGRTGWSKRQGASTCSSVPESPSTHSFDSTLTPTQRRSVR